VSVTITAVSPAAGHTGGKTFVEIDGTGFVLAATPAPLSTGATPAAAQTVGVWFGGVPALAVFVVSSTLVYAITPPTAPTKDAAGRGTLPTVVDVLVANVDGSGNPLPGQSATSAQAYTYLLPDPTSVGNESDLARLLRTWVQMVRAQVTPNMSWPKSTDFDQDTGDFLSKTDLPQLPGLVISELALRTNDFYSKRDPIEIDNGDGTYTTKAPPDTVDLVMSIVGVSNNPVELLNLGAVFRRFMRKNPRISMPRDPSNLGLGSVSYDLEWHEGRDMRVTALANASNLAHWAYDVAILGFDIEDMPGLPVGGPGDASRQHEATIGLSNEAETVTILPTFALPKGGEGG
jgi:IPT/TIG domain